MKKNAKTNNGPTAQTSEPSVASLIIKLHQQLLTVERKVDTLIGRVPERTFEQTQPPKPVHNLEPLPRPVQQFQPQQPRPAQQYEPHQRHVDIRPANHYRERTMHKAICADCRKECEVPFHPSNGRPVYCQQCFSKRKSNQPFKQNTGHRPTHAYSNPMPPAHKPQRTDKRKADAKRRPAHKKKR